jgi:hypothetical protein
MLSIVCHIAMQAIPQLILGGEDNLANIRNIMLSMAFNHYLETIQDNIESNTISFSLYFYFKWANLIWPISHRKEKHLIQDLFSITVRSPS